IENRYARLSLLDTLNDKAEDTAFWEESSYQLRQLLLSGKILFGDSLSAYLQTLTDRLLAGMGRPAGSVRTYAVKAAPVNAFATSDGIILVNVGLIASLHNEAELAFVMSHELSHVLEGHPRYLYNKTRELARDQRTRWRRPEPTALLTRANYYSQEIEQAADSMGLHIYLAAGFRAQDVHGAFEVLSEAHHPFGELDFQTAWLASPALAFPDSLLTPPPFLKKQALEPVGIENQTHPDPETRMTRLAGPLTLPVSDSLRLIPVSGQFPKLQSLARFETCYQYMLGQEYQAAFYSAYVLSQQYPENRFLRRLMTQTLYSLSKYSNVGRRWELLVDYIDINSPAREAYYFLEKLDSEALNMLALAYAWESFGKLQADTTLYDIAKDLMQDLGRYYGDRLDAYDPEMPLTPDSITTSFAHPALANLLREPAFAETLSDELKRVRRTRQHELTLEQFRGNYQSGKAGHELELKGFGLGLDKVVFVDPFYQRMDERPDRQGIRYAASVQGEVDYLEMLERFSQDIGLKYELISTQRMQAGDLGAFRELMLLRDWIGEETRHQQLNLINFHQKEVDALRRKYGTPYFVWTGGVGITRPRTGKGLVLTGGLIFWPALPYSVYYLLTPRHDTLLYSMIYNLETAEYVILYPKLLRMQDKPDVLQAATYDWLYQMHHRR
ncbi:MAG: M48 family metallopeptidase, partial [Bacteroidota bacterium]